MSKRPSAVLVAFALAILAPLACSDDPIGDRGTTRTSTSGGGLGNTSGNATGGGSNTGPSTVSTTGGGSPTTSGPGTGGPTSGPGSGGAGGASGGANGTGGARDGGAIMDAKSEADVPLPLCNYPAWVAMMPYKAGDIVMYMGKPYIATGDNPGLDPTISTFYWAPYTGCRPPPPPPPVPCPVLDKLLPNGEATFTQMFTPSFQGWVPLAAYSYASLCKALATNGLTGFVRSGIDVQDKREVAAFFANVAIETAYLTYIDESGHNAADQDYHGRGALQITGQAIYADCGAGLGLDLVGHPQLASTEPVVWQSGIWYWMLHANPSAGGTQICHQSIAQGNFGHTVRIIKGDCASADTRAAQYVKNCMLLNVDPGTTACQ
jgi:chitinase